MGRLITIEQLTPDPTWYFENAYMDRDGRGRWICRHPSPSWPAHCAIHWDTFYNNQALKVEIRRWIEANLSDSVLLGHTNKSYRYYRGEYRGWDYTWESNNAYELFWFESEESALLFKLRFSDIVVPVTYNHPKHTSDMIRTDSDRFESQGIDPYSVVPIERY